MKMHKLLIYSVISIFWLVCHDSASAQDTQQGNLIEITIGDVSYQYLAEDEAEFLARIAPAAGPGASVEPVLGPRQQPEASDIWMTVDLE